MSIEKKLEEAFIVKDGTHDSPKYVSKELGFPLITSKNLRTGKIDFSEIDYISKEDFEKINQRSKVDKGDILLAMIGTIGNPVLVEETPNFAIKNVALFKKNKNNNSMEYLKFFLGSEKIKRKLIHESKGGTQKFISLGYLRKLKILLPSIPEQIKIAKILSEVEELIIQRKESITLLDELVKSTFYKMFGDSVTNPKSFEKGTIRDLVSEVKYGTSSKADENGEYPYLRMNNITYDGHMDFTDLKFINLTENEREKYIVKKGDILFNRTNSKELVGKTGIYNENREMAIAGYLIRTRVNEKANPYYIWAYLNSKHGKMTLENMCKSIVGMANINAQELQEIKILIPPIELQNKFAKIVEEIEEIKTHYHQSLKELEKLFGVLSQKAFKGELDLSKMEFEAEDNDLKKDSGQARMTLENEKELDNLNNDSKQLKISFEEDSKKVSEKKTSENFEKDKFGIIKYAETDIRSKFHQSQPLSYDENGIIDYSAYNHDLKFKYDNLSFEYLHGIIMQDKLKGKFSFKELEDELKSLSKEKLLTKEEIQEIIVKMLENEPPFLEQIYDYSESEKKKPVNEQEKKVMFKVLS